MAADPSLHAPHIPDLHSAVRFSFSNGRRPCHQREVESSEAAEGEGVQQQLQYNSRKVFQFMHEIVTAMAPHHPDISLRLFLECTQVGQADTPRQPDKGATG